MRLQTDRLILRPFDKSDGRALYSYLSDPEVVKFEPYGVMSLAECEKEAERRQTDEAFIAVCLKDGTLIGNIYLSNADEFNCRELGYVFSKHHQGKGYATEACQKCLEYAFTALNARRVIAMCDPQNTQSYRLLERLGMRREAHFIENVYFHKDANGEPIWKDTYVYSILKSEFVKQTYENARRKRSQ